MFNPFAGIISGLIRDGEENDTKRKRYAKKKKKRTKKQLRRAANMTRRQANIASGKTARWSA